MEGPERPAGGQTPALAGKGEMRKLKKIARAVVRHRVFILVLAALLLIPSALGAVGTYINYDILSYLPPQLDSMVGEKCLDEDFGLASTAMVTVEGLPYTQIKEMKEEMEAVPGVTQVFWLNDVLDPSVPPEMLPSDLKNFLYGENDSTLLLVRFEGASASASTMNAISQLKKILRQGCFMGGVSVILEDTKDLINSEIPWYILCAVAGSLLVLLLAMKNTAVPFIFLLGILFPIAYNFGSNILFGQISYVTMALALVLQLGVTMDFSIFLLHRYQEEKAGGRADEEAMVGAICKTFSSITASSLTTIAGFLALCTMNILLGRDIGLVMAKGVALGVLCTLTVLPSLILCLRGVIDRHTHPTFIPRLHRLAGFVTSHHRPILALFLVLFIPFALAQSKVEVYYKLFDSLPQDMTGIVGTKKLSEDFGMMTSHFVLVRDDLSSEEARQLSSQLEEIDGVTQVICLDKYLGPFIPRDALPQDVRDLASAGGHNLILVNSAYDSGTDQLAAQLGQMETILKAADPDALITGDGPLTNDLIEVCAVDFANVSVTSILAVFLIVALSFQSVSIPVLLVVAIEAAIYINLGIPYFSGTVLPFIANIVLGTIQLGATVDYAILMTTRFREELSGGLTAKQAARAALENCSQSILSSGLSFFAATVGVSLVSRMDILKSLCALIRRGALISMGVILIVLPCLLITFEPIIRKTTRRWAAPVPKERVTP